jgi:hypothetical protein
MSSLTNCICAFAICIVFGSFPCATAAAPQQDDTALNNRGDHVMGFDHDKTTHHFELTKTGGVIQVRANDSADSASRDHIRMHLQHISKSFAAGDFKDPMDVHAEEPPGVPVMKKMRSNIAYRYKSIDRGGRVAIQTKDAEALEAVHEYLKYQIREHKTGDSTSVK